MNTENPTTTEETTGANNAAENNSTDNTNVEGATNPTASTTATDDAEEKPEMTEKEKKDFFKRVDKAFKGLDTRGLVHQINHLFPDERTASVANRILKLKDHNSFDTNILEAIESIR